MGVSIEFAFDVGEHQQAADAVLAHSWFRWVPRIMQSLLFVVIAVAGLAAATSDSPGRLLLSVSPWILLLLFWTVLLRVMHRRNARKVARSDPSAQGLQWRSLDDAGFHSRGNGVSLDIPWHAFLRGVETEAFFLFYYNKLCAYYIGKARLSASDTTAIRSLMRQHLGDRMTELRTRDATRPSTQMAG